MSNTEVLRIQNELLNEIEQLAKKKSCFKDKKIKGIEQVR